VFPSFIAAIFIDDILRNLHHPYVLQSVYDDGVMSLFIPRVRWMKDRYGEPERGSEWEPIKILLEGDGNSN
jgi:hypothetical protein